MDQTAEGLTWEVVPPKIALQYSDTHVPDPHTEYSQKKLGDLNKIMQQGGMETLVLFHVLQRMRFMNM